MSENKNFHLPDLGEGLPDATIVEWFVKVGDVIALDAPLVSMETAKAVVEVPSPFSGKVLALAGGEGDIIPTGSVLAQFELDPNMPQRADGQDTGHSHGHAAPSPTPSTGQTAAAQPDRVVASDNGARLPSPAPSAMTPAPWLAPCRAPMPCTPNRPSPWAGSRPCRPCAPPRASWAWTLPGCVPPAPMAR